MPDLKPFRGIRYSSTSRLADLVCPPYDVISETEQQRLHQLNPHNAIRLELAQKNDGEAGYTSVRDTFEQWIEEDVLKTDPVESLYVYRQDFTGVNGQRRRVAGVIGALHLEPFGAGAGILPHERTMPGPKEDRLALMRACPVNFSPIYAIYRGDGGLAPYLDSLEHRPTAARFVGGEAILHRFWVIDAPAEVAMLRAVVAAGPLVIADGHHRYETALAFQQESPGLAGAGSIMCFCVDADHEELVVLPYHRIVRAAASSNDLRERAHSAFGARPIRVEEASQEIDSSSADHAFVLILSDEALLIEMSDQQVETQLGTRAQAWRRLSVVALHEVVLPQLLPEGIDELVFTRETAEVATRVAEGWTAGVLLKAVEPREIVDVAASGERMPQKASYFWPKAITGLVFHSLQ